MHVGKALLERARASGHDSLVVVGTGKNVGKTVAIAAVCDALSREGAPFALCSIGRDGEAVDAVEGSTKPRLFLRQGTLIATARVLLPPHPAAEILESQIEKSALGPLAIARVRAGGFYEISGPPSATAIRRIARRLKGFGAEFVAVDGAVDRIAALRDGEDAIVVATGAASGPTPARVVDEIRALVACLRIARYDPARDAVFVDGALTASAAAAFVRAGERRQIVVHDATRIAVSGRTFVAFARDLDLRCIHALHPIACTVAPRSNERAFEPAAFLRSVAAATELPCYDVYAGAEAFPPVAEAS
jgi:hypothetical protein